MCGIVGSISQFDHTIHMEQMLAAISHRGPDAHQTYLDQHSGKFISLGHRRLSIIDLTSHSDQPFIFDNLAMVYNGEVYNFVEIRSELERAGYDFNTQGDTEVVIKAFHRWGLSAVNKFHGMFAIGLYDKKLGQLHLIRDRVGVKPLHYFIKEGILLFSSELKALVKSPSFEKKANLHALDLFMRLGYIPQELTAFENCHKILPGQYATIDVKTLRPTFTTYWNVQSLFGETCPLNYAEARGQLKKILIESVGRRLIADVPVGLYLSGGYDSSLVAAMAAREHGKKLSSMTVKFESQDLDESEQAKKIAHHLGLEHSQITCTEKDFEEIFHLLPGIFDEPFGDYSAIPSLLISSHAKKQCTVVLSADGGDESFWGYNKYRWYEGLSRKREAMPVLLRRILGKGQCLSKIAGFLPIYNLEHRMDKISSFLGRDHDNAASFVHFSSVFPKENPLTKPFSAHGFPRELEHQGVNSFRIWDFLFYLPDDILTKVDRTTMYHSLEGREPLLDQSIIEFAAGLPLEFLYRDGKSKYILRDITHDYIKPEIIDFKKKGFTPPLANWLDGRMAKFIQDFLSKEKVLKRGLLDPDFVQRQVKAFYASPHTENPLKIWNILMAERWIEKWRPEV